VLSELSKGMEGGNLKESDKRCQILKAILNRSSGEAPTKL
jgi:hypothetical protein